MSKELKILINNEEVVCDKQISIKEEMLSTSSTILKNCYPKSWENDKDYTSKFYFPKDYSKCKIFNETYYPEKPGLIVSGSDLSIEYDNTLNYEINELKGNTYQQTYTGKNLLKNTNVNSGDNNFWGNYSTFDENTGTLTRSTTATSERFIEHRFNLKNNTKYTVSCLAKSNGYVYRMQMLAYNASASKVYATGRFEITNQFTKHKFTFTTDGNTDFTNAVIRFDNEGSTQSGTTATLTIKDVMLVEGEDTDFEPYVGGTASPNPDYPQSIENVTGLQNVIISNEDNTKSKSYEINLGNIELNKIGDYQDRIYKQNNKWYIEKKIGKVVLDGSESILKNKNMTYVYQFIVQNYANQTNIYDNNALVMSNYFKYKKGDPTNSTNEDYIWQFQNFLVVDIRKTITPTLEDFKTWLSNNKPEIKYILATPEITEITNTDLIEQLESIELLNGTNNINVISSNLSGILNIHYNYKEAYTVEDIIFCGCVKNTGNISLNPREPHYVDLQVLDFKTLLSEGETLNYVIANKTISEAISQVINSISDYGFVLGDINLSNSDEIIGAYSTLNKTAYDVFQYFADITQSKWTTRMIDEDTIAIDFYDPLLMEKATTIENTKTYAENNKIIDISFNYSTNDYRNKQIITSDEVFANITQTETILADGYAKNFNCQNKIGIITEIKTNGVTSSFITKNEQELGLSADYIYTPGKETLESSNVLSSGTIISITYYPIVKGREIVLNTSESSRISNQINRKGTISRYENRNDTTSSQELIKIGQSYIKYKGQAEITLKVVSEIDLFNVGQIVEYQAPLEELTTDYLVKSKTIDIYISANKVFYTYELSSNFNSENAINYFDNQRAKNQGNIGEGETITRNIDIENTALIQFYDTDIEEVEVGNYTSLDFSLDGVII